MVPALSAKQKEAVTHALTHNFTAIVGDEGAGKKQTLRAILDLFRTFYPRAQIEVLSPHFPLSKFEDFFGEFPGVTFTTLSNSTLSNTIGKRKPKAPQLLVVFGAELASLDTWNNLFTSPRLFSLQKLILIGDTNLEYFGKSHLFWNMLANGRTQSCQIRLDDSLRASDTDMKKIIHVGQKIMREQKIGESSAIHIRYLGRDQKEWRSHLKEFLMDVERRREIKDTLIFVPNRKYKEKLNRLCQLLWNKNESDVECTLLRSGSANISLESKGSYFHKSDYPFVHDDEDDLSLIPGMETKKKEELQRMHLEFNASRKIKKIRMKDRLLYHATQYSANFFPSQDFPTPIEDGTFG